MNPNNYTDLEFTEFIEIIEGQDSNYTRPQRAVPLVSHNVQNQALEASGIEPNCIIYLPTLDLRQKKWREHTAFSQYNEQNRPDPNENFVYRIKTLRWNRGMNLYTGEGIKPELICGIDLQNCEFNGSFSIINVQSKSTIHIGNCNFVSRQTNEIDSGLIITSSRFKEVNISDTGKSEEEKKTIKQIKIVDLTANKLIINGLKIEKLYIQGDEGLIKNLSIYNCNIDEIIISQTEFEEISILNSTIRRSFYMNCCTKKFSLIGKNIMESEAKPIDRFNLSLSEQVYKGEYFIRDAFIRHLEISGDNNSRVFISESEIRKIVFSYLTNNSDLRLHNIRSVNHLSIENSSMGKAEFSNLDLSTNNRLEVIKSNLLEIVLLNTVFVKSLIGSSEQDYRGIREAFRQLKYASSKQGDRINELFYEALEMNAYQKDKYAKKTWDEKSILFVNKITNNHGQSWLQAFGLLVIFTTSMFFLIKYTLGYTLVLGSFSSNDFSEYLEFSVNPLHDFDKIFKYNPALPKEKLGYAKLYDFCSKFFGGVILFQLIRAFRKYVRGDAS